MILSGLTLKIRLFDAYSLKDKRSIVKSICQKTRHKYNITIAEVDALDLHNMAVIGLAIVSNDQGYNQQVLDSAIQFIELNYPVEITEIIDY